MKRISLFLIYALIHTQAAAQFRNKETNKICSEIKNGKLDEASKALSKTKKPELSNKSLKPFISYYYLKFTLKENEDFSQTEAQNSLDTILVITNLFSAMPERGLFNRNTKNKLVRDCPLIDVNGKCFVKLEKYWNDTLAQLKNGPVNKNKINGGEKNNLITKDDPKRDSILVVLNQARRDSEQYKIMLKDSFKKSTIKATAKELKEKKSPAVNDSVFVDFVVHSVDSIELEVYFVSHESFGPDQTISGKHKIAEYCNEKVSSLIENGVFDITRRWFSLYNKDTLNISATIIGEADDIWADTSKLQTFTNDCCGIGSEIGLKTGDKINNETIATLRSLNAKTFLKSGIKKTESYLKNNSKNKTGYVSMKSPVLYSKDWMKNKSIDEGPEFRKETIILKCDCSEKAKT
ncbi:MAG: hypothetical protein WAV23_02250 [Minisyncoccia bacterium]